ncbi:Rpn family recombination-promoting nuclease/putative transposase [Escherichia coli]|nr:Rpn family recombination-promoting nuclease/putative transposase [Escherichia coli]
MDDGEQQGRENPPTPHDAVLRAFMVSAEVARDIVDLPLPLEYHQLCDVSTLRCFTTENGVRTCTA